MTVAGFANRVGVKPDTVRYYERIGLLPVPALDLMRFIQGAQERPTGINESLVVATLRMLVEAHTPGELCGCVS